MEKAKYIGTTSWDFFNTPGHFNPWEVFETEDIIDYGIITEPDNHIFTLGSGVHTTRASMATTPAYQLPTNSQMYYAGRDVFRWGGTKNPNEISFDRYGFTPDLHRGVVIAWVAPKTEPHQLSELPNMFDDLPEGWRDICKAVIDKQL